MTPRMHCTANTPLGLEQIAAEEMHELGLQVDSLHVDEGLVEWRGEFGDVIRANRELRTVERIAVTAGEVRALHFSELRKKAAQIPWETWIDGERAVALRVTSRGSKLYHERGIAERMAGAIGDRLGRAIEVKALGDLDDPSADVQLVIVRMEHNVAVVRMDRSGERLHRRGYRLATAKAPLRETLAAAILRASGWRPGHALVDPFCGSGTFAIEAAQWSAGIAPGGQRHFAWERWPSAVGSSRAIETAKRTHPDAPIAPIAPLAPLAPILASDREAGALTASRSNAERAGVLDRIEFSQRTVSHCEPPAGAPAGWIVTNPPYARRTDGGADPHRLYETFGAILRERFAGWRCTMLSAEDSYAQATGITWEIGPWINNGGIRVRLLHAADLQRR